MPPTNPQQNRARRYRSDPDPVFGRMMNVLQSMREQRIDLAMLLLGITSGPELVKEPAASFELSTLLMSNDLVEILQLLHHKPREHDKSIKRTAGAEKIEDFSFRLVQRCVEKELDAIAPIMHLPREEITPDELLSIDMSTLIAQVKERAPRLWHLIFGITYAKEQQNRNTHKDPTPRVFYIICVALYTRSTSCSKFIKLISFYMKSCGLAAKAFDTLNALGLTFSQKWAYKTVVDVAKQAQIDMKRAIKTSLFHVSHDNLNIPFRVQEQRKNNKNHFDSGTAGTIYVISDPNVRHPNIPELQAKRRIGRENLLTEAEVHDLANEAAPRLRKFAIYQILRVLITAKAFDFKTFTGRDNAVFKRPASTDQLLSGPEHRTVQYRLETIHQEEATYEGNDRVVECYIKSLGFDTPEKKRKLALEHVLTWTGDLLTQQRLETLRRMRLSENNSFERMDWLIPLFGWFHFMMAFARSLHKQYYGSLSGRGLARDFQVMNRSGLSKPATQGTFHHTLDEALFHSFNARVRDIWMEVVHVSALEELRNHSPESLYNLAEKIYDSRLTSASLYGLQNEAPALRDRVYEQSHMFVHDMLDYLVLDDAQTHGDVGTMRDSLPRATFRFAGGTNHKYSTACYELMHCINKESDDATNRLVSASWLINNTGRPDGYLATDKGQEHNVGDDKDQYAASGANNSWDYLKAVSPAVPCMRASIDHVELTVNPYSRYKKHTSPDAEDDIETLRKLLAEDRVHARKPGRKSKDKFDNTVSKGYQGEKLTSVRKR